MAELKIYSSFEEKEKFFIDNRKINTPEEFDIFITIGCQNLKGKYYRGCHEAKYRLYNSLQRFWIENEISKTNISYDDLILKFISKAKEWNNQTINKYFEALKIDCNNILALLSFLRHSEVPTPVIDFSKSIDVGLFFAFDKLNYSPSNNEIDNYVSLYSLPENFDIVNMCQRILDINEIIEKRTNFKNINEQFIRETYQKLNKRKVVILKDQSDSDSVLSLKIKNSLNIINQKGILVYYSSQENSLEEEINSKEKIICINIHKNLKDYVLQWLKKNNITKDFIYPETNKLKDYCIENILTQCSI